MESITVLLKVGKAFRSQFESDRPTVQSKRSPGHKPLSRLTTNEILLYLTSHSRYCRIYDA